MAGSYGWNVEDVELYEEEMRNPKMPVPYDEESSSSDSGSVYSHPQVKGCCFSCCCPQDDDEIPSVPQGPHIDLDPRGFYWCPYDGSLPDTAVKAGVDKDGGNVYVGRAIHEGEMHPAKVTPNHGCAYVAYNGEEHSASDFEILCRGSCRVMWQECSDGAVPPEAVIAGTTSDNEKLYVGRVFYDGVHIPGKVHPSHGCCYIPYDGAEMNFTTYEVLVLQ